MTMILPKASFETSLPFVLHGFYTDYLNLGGSRFAGDCCPSRFPVIWETDGGRSMEKIFRVSRKLIYRNSQ